MNENNKRTIVYVLNARIAETKQIIAAYGWQITNQQIAVSYCQSAPHRERATSKIAEIEQEKKVASVHLSDLEDALAAIETVRPE